MNIQMLIDMPDDEFEQCVSQAIKGRRDHPSWWEAVTDPAVIDDTEQVVKGFVTAGELQAQDPARYPAAAGFVKKMHGILAEITLERIVRGDGVGE